MAASAPSCWSSVGVPGGFRRCLYPFFWGGSLQVPRTSGDFKVFPCSLLPVGEAGEKQLMKQEGQASSRSRDGHQTDPESDCWPRRLRIKIARSSARCSEEQGREAGEAAI